MRQFPGAEKTGAARPPAGGYRPKAAPGVNDGGFGTAPLIAASIFGRHVEQASKVIGPGADPAALKIVIDTIPQPAGYIGVPTFPAPLGEGFGVDCAVLVQQSHWKV